MTEVPITRIDCSLYVFKLLGPIVDYTITPEIRQKHYSSLLKEGHLYVPNLNEAYFRHGWETIFNNGNVSDISFGIKVFDLRRQKRILSVPFAETNYKSLDIQQRNSDAFIFQSCYL